MPYLSEITQLINVNLKATTLSDKRFDKGSFKSIARLLPRNEEDNNVLIPSIIPNNGDAVEITIDDRKPFLLYHRILDLKYERGEANGDSELRREIANMTCIVYGDRNILKTDQEQIIAAIDAGFLDELSETDKNTYSLQRCNIIITDTNLNSISVYSQEYSGNVEYILKPNQFMIALNYTITSEYDKSCVDIC